MVVRNISHSVPGPKCMVVRCQECGTEYLSPGHFSGMRSVPPTANDLLTYWDYTTEDFEETWTWYYEHQIKGYEQSYVEVMG